MNIRLIESPWHAIPCDALLVPLFRDDDFKSGLACEMDQRLEGLLSELRENGEWKGRPGDLNIIYRPSALPAKRLILLGAGSRKECDCSAIRTLIMNAVHQFKNYSLNRFAVVRRSDVDPALAAQAAVEGVVLGTFDIDEYKTIGRSKTRIEEILFASEQPIPAQQVEKALKRGEITAQATNLARALVNEPANRVKPIQLAEKAREIGERFGMEVEILEEPQLEDLGMNALTAVARGSDEPARFIVLKHHGGNHAAPPIVFIGKGITFDSGGLSLKPPQSMEEMKTDKAGGCAVLAAMQAIAQLQLPRNVVGIIPAAENLPSGRAQRPGDVVRSISGKTIEVLNTDAEGRLILADAIGFAKQLNPVYMVDIATLTGACVVALGKVRAGAFCNNDALFEKVSKASEISGEKLWRMPLDEEYGKKLESNIADIKNVGGRWGAACIAAKFIEFFVDDTPWCHLDIAGVDLYEENPVVEGPTGFGVRTLTELASL